MKKKDWCLSFLILFIWSSSSSLVSLFTLNTIPIIVASMVVAISSLILSLQFIREQDRKAIARFKFRELRRLIVPAVCGFFIYPIAYFYGINGATPIRANVLNYLWPLVAFVASKLINKRKTELIEALSIILGTVGGYIVLCFNESMSISRFEISNINYSIVALLGAFTYGIYTATIESTIPRINDSSALYDKNNPDKNTLPARLRLCIMMIIALLFHIPIIVYCLVYMKAEIEATFSMVFSHTPSLLTFLFYSIVNFTFAHLLWNKLNTSASITLTTSIAFLIPFFSTFVLSRVSNTPIGSAASIGLILIVLSIMLNNYRNINSINATFSGILVLIILTFVTPIVESTKTAAIAKFYLQIIVSIYAIYYGFIMNRVINDLKELERIIDTLNILKSGYKAESVKQLQHLEREYFLTVDEKEKNRIKADIKKALPKNQNTEEVVAVMESYNTLFRCRAQAMSVSEWLVLLILSLTIVALCFFVRNGDILADIIMIVIGATLCLCVSSLYEIEIKKRRLLGLMSDRESNIANTMIK